jgi:hypothetical protein
MECLVIDFMRKFIINDFEFELFQISLSFFNSVFSKVRKQIRYTGEAREEILDSG